MSESNQHIARAFAFSGATFMLGVVIFFLTQPIIPLVELPDIAGWIFSLGFIFIFFNMSGVMARRFCSRTFEMERYPYVLSLILILPTFILSVSTDRFSGWGPMLFFFFLITVSTTAGAYIGIRSGQKKRDRLIREALKEAGEELTDEEDAPPREEPVNPDKKTTD
ncbi:hypothetical protein QLX67_07745 [Balneolaceae bacterium ANBcel3]|nr:hypothetical protein [Balneolaceae bacterium ANBcel3]